MSEHLPECQLVNFQPDESFEDCTICFALRACEQRVREDERESCVRELQRLYVMSPLFGGVIGAIGLTDAAAVIRGEDKT